MTTTPEKILVINCPDTDSEAVNHLIDHGDLPHLERCVERGALAPLNWTPLSSQVGDTMTIATGALPYCHGAVAAFAPRSDGLGQTPICREHLHVTPLWECWSAQNIPSCAIGWPATHRTKETSAHVVADTFFQIDGPSTMRWAVFPNSVHPWQEIDTLKHLRTHPAELDLKASPFANVMATLLKQDRQRASIIFSRLNTMVAICRHYLANHNQAVFLNLDLLAKVGMPKTEAEAQLILGYYELLDTAIGQLLEATQRDTKIAIIIRPPSAALNQGGEAVSGRGQAVFVSPHHEPDSLMEMIHPRDIAPKLCAMMGAEPVSGTHSIAHLSSAPADADPNIAAQLAQHHEKQKPILKSAARLHQNASLQLEAEFLRSLVKAMGPEAGLNWIQSRESKQMPESDLVLALAERLIRDRKLAEAKHLLERKPKAKELEARWQFLVANLCLMEGQSDKAVAHIQEAHRLAPHQQDIKAMWSALTSSKQET